MREELTFNEAITIVKNNKGLIGNSLIENTKIEDLLIVPYNRETWEPFIEDYYRLCDQFEEDELIEMLAKYQATVFSVVLIGFINDEISIHRELTDFLKELDRVV